MLSSLILLKAYTSISTLHFPLYKTQTLYFIFVSKEYTVVNLTWSIKYCSQLSQRQLFKIISVSCQLDYAFFLIFRIVLTNLQPTCRFLQSDKKLLKITNQCFSFLFDIIGQKESNLIISHKSCCLRFSSSTFFATQTQVKM